MVPDCPHCDSSQAVEEWEGSEGWFYCQGCQRGFQADEPEASHGSGVSNTGHPEESVSVSRHPRGGSWTGPEGEEFCHKCNADTKWVPLRQGSKRVKCEGCGDVYPCRSKCDHLDCLDDKERLSL